MDKVIHLQWHQLSPDERIRCCRDFAAEALGIAASKRPGEREHYLRIAAEWLSFAKEIEDASYR